MEGRENSSCRKFAFSNLHVSAVIAGRSTMFKKTFETGERLIGSATRTFSALSD